MKVGEKYVSKLLVEQRLGGSLFLQMQFTAELPDVDKVPATFELDGKNFVKVAESRSEPTEAGQPTKLDVAYLLAEPALSSWAANTLVQGERRLVYQRGVVEDPQAFVKRVLGERADTVPEELWASIGECATYLRPAKLTNREWIDSWLASFERNRGWYATKSKIQLVQYHKFDFAAWNAVTTDDIREKLQLQTFGSHSSVLPTPNSLLPPSSFVLYRQIDSNTSFLVDLLSAESSSFSKAGILWPRGPMMIEHNAGKLFVDCVRYHFVFEPNSDKIANAMAGVSITANPVLQTAFSGKTNRVAATFDSWKSDDLALFSISDEGVLVYKASNGGFEYESSRQIVGRIVTPGRVGSDSESGLYFSPVKGDICELEFEQGAVPRCNGIILRRSSVPSKIASYWKSEGKVRIENAETAVNDNLRISSSESTFSQKSTIKDVEIG